jgi:hypothetical protein
VVFLESVAMASALAYGLWAWRKATMSLAALTAQLEQQRSAGERRESKDRTSCP